MKNLNKDGINGPFLKELFSCEKCKYLSTSTLNQIDKHMPYKCTHDNIIKNQNTYRLMTGDINNYKITPDFCPFLIKVTRKEKINKINEK